MALSLMWRWPISWAGLTCSNLATDSLVITACMPGLRTSSRSPALTTTDLSFASCRSKMANPWRKDIINTTDLAPIVTTPNGVSTTVSRVGANTTEPFCRVMVLARSALRVTTPVSGTPCCCLTLVTGDVCQKGSMGACNAPLRADIGSFDIAPVDIAPVDIAPVDIAPVDIAPVDIGSSDSSISITVDTSCLMPKSSSLDRAAGILPVTNSVSEIQVPSKCALIEALMALAALIGFTMLVVLTAPGTLVGKLTVPGAFVAELIVVTVPPLMMLRPSLAVASPPNNERMAELFTAPTNPTLLEIEAMPFDICAVSKQLDALFAALKDSGLC